MFDKIEYIYRAYRFRLKIDKQEINFLLNNLSIDDSTIDIGCHKGAYLYWMKKKIGNNGNIIAFEPQKILYDYLIKIKNILNYKNVLIENIGLSSKTGKAKFFVPKTKSGTSPGARIGNIDENENNLVYEIDVNTLDNYFLESDFSPKLIKIDVEGHEKDVILGGKNFLSRTKPIIIVESESRHLASGNVFELFDLLRDMGYRGLFFENGVQKPIENFNPEIHQKNIGGRFWEAPGYVNNFIFKFD